MKNRVLILAHQETPAKLQASLEKLGYVTTELAEIYQQAKEKLIDLIIFDGRRTDMLPAVASRLRRYSGLCEIWRLVSEDELFVETAQYIDGQIAVGSGGDGLKKKVSEILADKQRLSRYGIVGRSAKMKAVARTIERIAPSDVPVLIVGPSGSGKELVALALHSDSGRTERPFVAINCGALAEGLLESELFGHEKGAFTGSVGKREGLFSKAEGGTIFLDEIGETTPAMQVKLLRVLEDGTFYPVGSSSLRRSDVRVVAATNRDLAEAIAERQFREDLYFRLGVVKIVLPPLMERREDIQPLLRFFWEGKSIDYSDSALDLLLRYDWPGNVRQLKNFASSTVALGESGLVDRADVERFISEQHVHAKNLPVATGKSAQEAGQELIYRAILSLGNEIRMLRNLITSNLPSETSQSAEPAPMEVETSTTMEEMEKKLIEKALLESGSNRKETARQLGIGERTLYRKLNKYGLG